MVLSGVVGVSVLVVVVLFSLLSSLTSDLNMRMERPSERAASGSLLAPKKMMTTTAMMTHSHTPGMLLSFRFGFWFGFDNTLPSPP